MKNLTFLFCGILFGVGLAMSGMTDTAKVLGFLDVFGEWVPDLIFVMGGAVIVTVIAFRWILKSQPLFSSHFDLSNKKSIDTQLISGATLFGIGWGVYGYCPGPAIASLSYLDPQAFIFVLAMLFGMALANFFQGKLLKK